MSDRILPVLFCWRGRHTPFVVSFLDQIHMEIVDNSPTMQGAHFYAMTLEHQTVIAFLVAIGLTPVARYLVITQAKKQGARETQC